MLDVELPAAVKSVTVASEASRLRTRYVENRQHGVGQYFFAAIKISAKLHGRQRGGCSMCY